MSIAKDCISTFVLTATLAMCFGATVASSGPLQTEFSDTLRDLGPGWSQSSAFMKMSSAKLIGSAPENFWDTALDERLDDGEVSDEMLRQVLEFELLDASSARFGRVRAKANMTRGGNRLHTQILVCGDINARNANGGYSGYEPFVIQFINPNFLPNQSVAFAVGYDWIKPFCRELGL